MSLQNLRHFGSGLAGTDDKRLAFRGCGQVRREAGLRVSAIYGNREQVAQYKDGIY
jgi:hypothetical protein